MKNQKINIKRSHRHTELKKKSLEQPGIKDLMIIYNHWRESYKAEQAHQEIQETSYTTFNSDTSNPKNTLLENTNAYLE